VPEAVRGMLDVPIVLLRLHVIMQCSFMAARHQHSLLGFVELDNVSTTEVEISVSDEHDANEFFTGTVFRSGCNLMFRVGLRCITLLTHTKLDLRDAVQQRCTLPANKLTVFRTGFLPCGVVKVRCLRGTPVSLYSIRLFGVSTDTVKASSANAALHNLLVHNPRALFYSPSNNAATYPCSLAGWHRAPFVMHMDLLPAAAVEDARSRVVRTRQQRLGLPVSTTSAPLLEGLDDKPTISVLSALPGLLIGHGRQHLGCDEKVESAHDPVVDMFKPAPRVALGSTLNVCADGFQSAYRMRPTVQYPKGALCNHA